MEKQMSEAYLKARLNESVKEVLEKVVDNVIVHHTPISYGDFIKPFELLAIIKVLGSFHNKNLLKTVLVALPSEHYLSFYISFGYLL
jgi:hypothetical protein